MSVSGPFSQMDTKRRPRGSWGRGRGRKWRGWGWWPRGCSLSPQCAVGRAAGRRLWCARPRAGSPGRVAVIWGTFPETRSRGDARRGRQRRKGRNERERRRQAGSGVRRGGAWAARRKRGAARSCGDPRAGWGQGAARGSIWISGSATLGAPLTTSLPPRIKMTAGECKWLARLHRLPPSATGCGWRPGSPPTSWTAPRPAARAPAPPALGPTPPALRARVDPGLGNKIWVAVAENCVSTKICSWMLNKCPAS